MLRRRAAWALRQQATSDHDSEVSWRDEFDHLVKWAATRWGPEDLEAPRGELGNEGCGAGRRYIEMLSRTGQPNVPTLVRPPPKDPTIAEMGGALLSDMGQPAMAYRQ